MISFTIPSTGGTAAPVPDTAVGHVNPTNGSDLTGDGSYAQPYATAQKAFDEGFTNIYLCGEGDAGTLLLDSGITDHLHIWGVGAASFASHSAVEGFTLDASSLLPRCELTIDNGTKTTHSHIYSNRGVMFHLTGELPLGSGAEVQFFNAIIGNVTFNGATGVAGAAGSVGPPAGEGQPGNAGFDGAQGEQGGPGGILYLENSMLIGPTVELIAGDGGVGGAGGAGSDAGAGGGDGGVGGNGGKGGTQGAGGYLVARRSIVTCLVDFGTKTAALGGVGGGGGVEDGGVPGNTGTDGATGDLRASAYVFGEQAALKGEPVGDDVIAAYRGSVVAGAFIATQG